MWNLGVFWGVTLFWTVVSSEEEGEQCEGTVHLGGKCPTMLCIPTTVQKKKNAFRFAHFIADKKELINIIKDAWDSDIDGYAMYKVVKILKKLKSLINKLGWDKGGVYERVSTLRNQIQEVHTQINSNPMISA
uniref:Uncharacterized protein n=1 Tax=Tanacetum cinerariifolium TaxID=118510 RepID=A0A6L2NTU9_TANCI|nr:hypothetical protein [Tanacetum cinerariifolium]